MNMEIGNKAAQFDFWENIIRTFFAVQVRTTMVIYRKELSVLIHKKYFCDKR